MSHERKQGIKEGEKNARLTIAQHLKEKGIDASLIAETTGLSIEEINDL